MDSVPLWQTFFELDFLIKLFKTVLFICGVALATSIMIPRGITMYFEWKEKKKKALLSSAVSYVANGILLLLLLLSLLVADLLKE
jgi:Sec-independent protein secretion pathway component TatC